MDLKNGTAKCEIFLKAINHWVITVVGDVGETEIEELYHDCFYVNPGKEVTAPVNKKLIKRIKPALESAAVQYVKSVLSESLEGNGVPEKAEILSKLEEKYQDRKQTWRPPRNPKEHLRTARIFEKEAQLNKFELLATLKRGAIENLNQQIEENRRRIKTNGESSVYIDKIRKTLNSNATEAGNLRCFIENSIRTLIKDSSRTLIDL